MEHFAGLDVSVRAGLPLGRIMHRIWMTAPSAAGPEAASSMTTRARSEMENTGSTLR